MHQLKQVSFCKDISDIGTGIFHDCPNLLVVKWNSPLTVESRFFDAPADMGNLMVYAPLGTNSTYNGNVVTGILADNIVFTDRKPLMIPTAFKAKSVSYSKSFNKTTDPGVAGGWETIVLPFDVDTFVSEERGALAPFNSGNVGVRPFWLAELTGNGFAYVTSLKTNRPYIIAMPNSDEYAEEFNIRGNVIFSASDAAGGVAVAATSAESVSKGPNFELVSTYETVAQGNAIYAINDNEYNGMNPGAVFVRNSRDIAPFEAYVRSLSNLVSSPIYYSIGKGMGEVNGIEQLYHQTLKGMEAYSKDSILYISSPCEQTLGIYSVDGRLVRLIYLSEGMNKEYGIGQGVYLVGITKVVVK